MKQLLSLFLLLLMTVFAVSAQSQISMNELLLPSDAELAEAENQGFKVFRLIPRGMFDYVQNELSIRGGGAYYSFVKRSHSYDETPQIQLAQGNLSVGFAGADYGFIADLGDVPLESLGLKNKFVKVLAKYKAKSIEAEAREEYIKGGKGFELNGLKLKSSQPSKFGNSYLLRAISYNDADTLVAFKVYGEDKNGVLTIFWKPLKNFEKPILAGK